jgi:hypothetical protein
VATQLVASRVALSSTDLSIYLLYIQPAFQNTVESIRTHENNNTSASLCRAVSWCQPTMRGP